MYFRNIGHILLIVLISILDITLVSELPWGLARISLLPVMLVFVFLLGNLRLAAWWVLIGGFMLELFNFGMYGFYYIGLLCSLVVINILFERVMTNRSLYSISVVTASSLLTYDLVLLAKHTLENNHLVSLRMFVTEELTSVGFGVIIALIFFYILNIVTRRLRPVFLEKFNLKYD